ncbi:MAG: helix-turn-helix domain-containing protein [Candidatus Aenigmarchaeota archaeon]|nr:helix-turn-helix domain-containing protein [Candidatus Aenigmarchaeota archaeon]
MKPYCETIVPKILPAVRSLIAKEMLDKYNLTQQQVSNKLNISQAAISQYYRNMRGTNIELLKNNLEIMQKIKELAKKIALSDNQYSSEQNICEICRLIRKNNVIDKLI